MTPSSARPRWAAALDQGQPRPHRIEFHVARARQQVAFVERKRVKALLPEVAAPSLAEVDAARVAAVGLAQGGAEPVFVRRHENEMDVVGHQAIGPHLGARLAAPLAEQGEIVSVIVVLEEHRQASRAALDHVMRMFGDDQSRCSWHRRNVARGPGNVNK